MSTQTRDGTAEPVSSRDQIIIIRRERGQENIHFSQHVQLTTSRIGNFTRLIHTLPYNMQWPRITYKQILPCASKQRGSVQNNKEKGKRTCLSVCLSGHHAKEQINNNGVRKTRESANSLFYLIIREFRSRIYSEVPGIVFRALLLLTYSGRQSTKDNNDRTEQ